MMIPSPDTRIFRDISNLDRGNYAQRRITRSVALQMNNYCQPMDVEQEQAAGTKEGLPTFFMYPPASSREMVELHQVRPVDRTLGVERVYMEDIMNYLLSVECQYTVDPSYMIRQ